VRIPNQVHGAAIGVISQEKEPGTQYQLWVANMSVELQDFMFRTSKYMQFGLYRRSRSHKPSILWNPSKATSQ
jgi:hypothetical protein